MTKELQARGLWPRRTAYRIGGAVHTRTDGPTGKRMTWTPAAAPRVMLYPDGWADGLEPGATVIVVEGEKAADAARSRGLNGVATVCGAAAIPTPETLKPLAAFDVLLSPDNDAPGRNHMEGVAAELTTLGGRPRWLTLTGMTPGGDLADYSGPDDELGALIAGAPAWQPAPVPVPGQSALVDWADFWQSDPAAEDWLIEPLLPRGRQVATYSPAKQGKSLLSLDVAARAATGQRVLDQRAGPPLSVVYFDLEMTAGDLYERLVDMGYGPESALSSLHYYQLPTLRALDTPEGGADVATIAKHHDADLVIIDTTSRVLGGPENDADTMRAFYLFTGLPLKAAGRTLWRLDHAGKDLGKGQRGTSAKNDDVDLVWELLAQDDGLTGC